MIHFRNHLNDVIDFIFQARGGDARVFQVYKLKGKRFKNCYKTGRERNN